MESKTFKSFLESENSKYSDEEILDAIKSLEDLGILDRTWTEEEIKSSLEGLEWMKNITYEFEFESISWDKKTTAIDGTQITLSPMCTGLVNVNLNTESLKTDLIKTLESLPRRMKEGKYDLEKIIDAFDSVRWKREINVNMDPVNNNLSHFVNWKFETKEIDTNPPKIQISAEVDLDTDDPPMSLKDLDPVNKVMENL